MADNQIRGTESQDCPSIRVTQNAGCPSIRVRLTGGGETPEAPLSDVNFYDYDGKRVASYTAADFAALTEMPANPSHQGLTAQGWNWSLSDAQAYVAANGKLNIGQQYITDDGKTRLYITIAEPGKMDVPLNFSQTVANGVTVDWGDGSATETAAGTGNRTITHTFAAPGDYVIALEVTSGTAALGRATNVPVIGPNASIGRVYSNMLKRAEIGRDMSFNQPFNYCLSLEAVAVPNHILAFSENSFSMCASLRYITIPPNATLGKAFVSCTSLKNISLPKSLDISAAGSALSACGALSGLSLPVQPLVPTSFFSVATGAASWLVIPEGVATLNDQAFSGCICLSKITLPSTITSIGSQTFNNCTGVAEIHCKSTAPPTIASNSFNGLQSDAKIYVPASAVAAYQGATNWSTYASQIVGE